MRIGIYGYGNLGRGVECAARAHGDVDIVGVFTRRDPKDVVTAGGTPVYAADKITDFKDRIDVLIICGGSATDLPKMTPELAKHFNVVDSFDTHAKIKNHFNNVDKSARENGHIALISGGWDPGIFSILRLYSEAVLPDGASYTFWGRGVSQGHSDAIRRIDGVLDARQYTLPKDEAIAKIRAGECPELCTREKHRRECFVVAREGADLGRIEAEIKEMPNYFADYDTTVTFVSAEELKQNHAGLPHGGSVIRNGKTGFSDENTHTVEFNLRLDSNPEFTASVLVAYARAILKMRGRGNVGCKTVYDVAPADLSQMTSEELMERLL